MVVVEASTVVVVVEASVIVVVVAGAVVVVEASTVVVVVEASVIVVVVAGTVAGMVKAQGAREKHRRFLFLRVCFATSTSCSLHSRFCTLYSYDMHVPDDAHWCSHPSRFLTCSTLSAAELPWTRRRHPPPWLTLWKRQPEKSWLPMASAAGAVGYVPGSMASTRAAVHTIARDGVPAGVATRARARVPSTPAAHAAFRGMAG